MTKKTRLIILLICTVLFLMITPYVVLYSLGYKIDFTKRKIIATGGIYVRVLPQETNITIDSNIKNKTGIFSNSIFVQNLLPREHHILIEKEGYYDYEKNLAVEENEVTKLENVILFKQHMLFEKLADPKQFASFNQTPPEKFTIKNNNLYYANSTKNSQLTLAQKNTPLLKSIVTYVISNNTIVWLSSDGYLEKSDIDGKNTEKLSEIAIKVNKKLSYQFTVFEDILFLQETNTLFIFDQNTKSFQEFYKPVKKIKISPDGQKILYYNNNEIFYSLSSLMNKKISLITLPEKIDDVYWVNSDYIIYNAGGKIMISEIDPRGNINTITLPQTITLGTKNIDIKNPRIFFNEQEKKLYILTDGNLLVSEKLVP